MQIVLLISNTLLFVFSAIVLVKASIRLIDTLYSLSRKIHISTFITGFFFLAIATSIPELLIGITSAMQQAPEISLGNVIGSNISNMTIIIGVAILVAGSITTNKKDRKEAIIAIVISSFFIILALDGLISQIDGYILITIFVIYSYRLLKSSGYRAFGLKENKKNLSTEIALIALLIILLLLSSEGIVSSAKYLAFAINIPSLVISLFIIAIGTSLPELSSMIPAIRKKRTGISIGNIFGSIVTNSTLVIGTTAIISPIKIVARREFIFTSIFTAITFLAFYIFLSNKGSLTKKEAVALIFLYISFLFIQILLEKTLFLS